MVKLSLKLALECHFDVRARGSQLSLGIASCSRVTAESREQPYSKTGAACLVRLTLFK